MIVDCNSIFKFISPGACDLHRPAEFHPNQSLTADLRRYIDFFKMGAMA